MARPKRFELLTPRFVVWCSIQLSYGRFGASRGLDQIRRFARIARPIGKAGTGRIAIGFARPWQAVGGAGPSAGSGRAERPPSGSDRLAARGLRTEDAIRDADVEGRPDRTVHQPDLAAVR